MHFLKGWGEWPSDKKEHTDPLKLANLGLTSAMPLNMLCELECLPSSVFLSGKWGKKSFPFRDKCGPSPHSTYPIGKFLAHINCSTISNSYYYFSWILTLSLGLSLWEVRGPFGHVFGLWIIATHGRTSLNSSLLEGAAGLRSMMNNFSSKSYISVNLPSCCVWEIAPS